MRPLSSEAGQYRPHGPNGNDCHDGVAEDDRRERPELAAASNERAIREPVQPAEIDEGARRERAEIGVSRGLARSADVAGAAEARARGIDGRRA
jgi:hypothetical protein